MKKILRIMTCIVMIFGTMVLTNNNIIYAASIDDTFTTGDLSYKITGMGDATTNGEVTITDFDETSGITTLTLPATVEHQGKTFDVVSADGNAFDDADKIKTLVVSKNFREFDLGAGHGFMSMNELDVTLKTRLDTIIVDEENPVLKVIDGVAYDMTKGQENFIFFPYNSPRKELIIPEFITTSTANHADDFLVLLPMYMQGLENLVMPFTLDNDLFVENGMLCRWVDENDHSQGSEVLMIPNAKKKVVLSEQVVDMGWVLGDNAYPLINKAEEFVVDENNEVYQSIDGNLYKEDALLLYPGGRTDAIYRIPEGTKRIGMDYEFVFLSNHNLKSIIIPSSVTTIGDGEYRVLPSVSLKSIKIEGNSNITWHNDSFTGLDGNELYYHIYVDNGNINIKQTIQQKFTHLSDDYFHEIGPTPITAISNVKTSVKNKKDVKVSWNVSESCDGYEVRRYDNSGVYEVVASITNTSFIDTMTAYQTAYQYEVVPYNLPVTSYNDVDDPLHAYKTYGVNSQRSSITTPIQKFVGTYIYKNKDGSETSVVKEVEANTSALQQAPKLPEVNGYVFDKWTTDLTNIEKVNKDFVATAVYKKKEVTPEIDVPEKPGETPEVKPTPNEPSDNVQTGDKTNVEFTVMLLVMSVGMIGFLKKKKQFIFEREEKQDHR